MNVAQVYTRGGHGLPSIGLSQKPGVVAGEVEAAATASVLAQSLSDPGKQPEQYKQQWENRTSLITSPEQA